MCDNADHASAMAVVFDSMQLRQISERQLPDDEDLHSAIDFGQISVGNHLGWLVANTDLESSWAPVNELNGALRFQCSNSGVHVIGDNITTVQKAGRHVFTIPRIAFDHLVVGLETGHRDLLHRVRFMGSLRGRNNRSVGNKREMNTRIGHEIGLEFVQVDVERTIEPKGSGDRGDNYGTFSYKVSKVFATKNGSSYLGRSIDLDFRSWASQYPNSYGRCHKWLHCPP